MAERVYLFDNAKFILILLVVVGHFADYFTADHASARSLFLFIYSFHMPLFIFLSGLFVRKMNEATPINLKRILSFISLGFVMKFIPLAYSLIVGYPISFSLLGDGGPAWFMFAIAAYNTLAWLLREASPRYVFAFSVALGLAVGYDSSIGDFLYLSRIIVFFPFFWLGYCFSPQAVADALSKNWIKVISAIIVIFFALVCITSIDQCYGMRYLFTGRNPFSAISPNVGWSSRLLAYLISFVMSAAVLSLTPRNNIPAITLFGSRTLQVYAWHGIVLDLLFLFGVDAAFQSCLGDYWFLWFIGLAIPTTLLLSFEPFGKPLRPFLRLDFSKSAAKQNR